MRKLPFTSRGDFLATVTLLLLIIAGLAFNFFYDKDAPSDADFSDFQSVVSEFYEQQAYLADSAAAAKAARDSAYQYRYSHKRWPQQRHFWNHREREYDTARRRTDTTHFSPIPQRRNYHLVKVELNSCDTSDIVRIPGFGSKRAQKIVDYRQKLGGFYSFEQLREIYILQNIDIAYCEKYFIIDETRIRRININTATYKELLAHPYFDAYLAKTITQYRARSGKIHNLEEFQKITHAYPELITQLKHYLRF